MNLEELERLARLRESGALTEEEFQEQKARLIYSEANTLPKSIRYLSWVIGIGIIAIAGWSFSIQLNSESEYDVQNRGSIEAIDQNTTASDDDPKVEAGAGEFQKQDVASPAVATTGPAKAERPMLPKFGNYTVARSNVSSPLRLVRGSPEWDYRTRLQQAHASAPNFDANSVVALWGCGTGCRWGAMVDRSSGEIFELPLGGEDNMYLEFKSEAGSNLLLGTWEDGFGEDAVCVFEAFVWSQRKFTAVPGYPVRKNGACPYPDE